MHPDIYVAVIGIFAAVGVILLVALAMRSPNRPGALASDAVDQAVALLLTALYSFACGYAVTVFLAHKADSYTAAALTVVITAASVTLIWRVFRVRRRLRLADGGVSPFRALPKDHVLPGGTGGTPLPV